MEDEYKVVCALTNNVAFDDLEWPGTPVSRSQNSLKTNISHTVMHPRDGSGSYFVTHVSHHTLNRCPDDPWPLHHFILRMGLEGGVAWTRLDNPVGLESKRRRWKLYIIPPVCYDNMTEWVSSFMSTKNKQITSYCAVISWSWVNGLLGIYRRPIFICATSVGIRSIPCLVIYLARVFGADGSNAVICGSIKCKMEADGHLG